MKTGTTLGFLLLSSILAGCGGSNDASSSGANGGNVDGPNGPSGGNGQGGTWVDNGPDSRPPPECLLQGADNATPFSKTYRVQKVGDTTFQGQPYELVVSMPWTYTLSAVQCNKTWPMVETDTHYIVDSKFELPYITGVMDDVAWTPGEKNKGWAIGPKDDPGELVAKNNGMRPFVYHVNAGFEYGYFTATPNDKGPGGIYDAFRPTWVVHPDGGGYRMFFINPTAADSQGFPWPRHGAQWELNFGLYVDPAGKVYVPKADKALVARKTWDDYEACVTINKANAPIPTTRTQFPGNESYYASHTFLPGYATPGSDGHKYWGQKGRSMEETAIWDDDGAPGLNSPGNYHKPYGGGCDSKGFNFAHSEGFTWPELRKARTAMGDIPTRDQLYKITLYRYLGKTQQTELLGALSYDQDPNTKEWLPVGSGPEAHPLDKDRGTWIINGPIFSDRGDHVFAILEDL
jgi:hypothetical protein